MNILSLNIQFFKYGHTYLLHSQTNTSNVTKSTTYLYFAIVKKDNKHQNIVNS